MSDSEYLKAHDAGLELMGRGSGVPESLKGLADIVETATFPGSTSQELPDSLIAALGRVLLQRRADRLESDNLRTELRNCRDDGNAAAESARQLQNELTECREALAEWHAKATSR